ncbi:MAG: hypothetical protein RR022_08340, partial [Angelakisella sp.]
VQFFGGIYAGVAAQALLREIFAQCNAQFTMEPALADRKLWGYLPVSSARAALAQVAFAIGGVVDTSRSDKIFIGQLPERPTRMIGLERKLQGQRLEQKKAVTAVELTVHSFVKSTEQTKAFEGTLPCGEALVLFGEPVCDPVVSGATLLEAGANHLRLSVAAAGTVSVTAKRYLDNRNILHRTVAEQSVNLQQNPIRVDNATLISPQNAAAVADRLVNYYRWQYRTEFSLLLGSECPADLLVVCSAKGDNLKGMVERVEVDLARGCIVGLTMVASRIETLTLDYAGELWAGQQMGVL